jgi:lipoprotein-anchoring transpeptidase ErfK/SrfK
VTLGVAVALGAGGFTAVSVAGEDAEPLQVTAASFELRGEGDHSAIVPAAIVPAPVVHGFRAAEALVPSLEAFAAPSPAPGTSPSTTAANPTHEGFPLVVSVIDQSPDGDWLHVRLPQRPNGTTGWVRAADVRLWDVPNRIEVSIGERTLRVYEGDSDTVLFEAMVAVGADRTPTPVGDFFIDIVNPLGHDRVYGWGQLSVAGFSDVLERFAGGIGQIAIHGWNDPSAMGRNISNGCVRMNNDDIAQVAELAPLGTPVTVRP